MESTSKKVLVTGANGQLGSEIRYWQNKFPEIKITFTDVAELNITNNEEVDAFITKNKFDFVINCAAYTAVDKAESDREKAFALNAVAVDFLVDALAKINGCLIHISTDYVFDGEKNVPYSEDDATFPGSVYGETKNEGEKLILYSEIDAMIVRTSWLYSTYGNNFVKTMLRLSGEKKEIGVIYDQVGSPTYARDLAQTLLEMVQQTPIKREKPIKDVYHFTNEGVTSWYDFAVEIFRYKKIKCKVNPIETVAYPTPAKRPKFSVLKKDRIKEDFGLTIPHWVDSLHQMLDNLN